MCHSVHESIVKCTCKLAISPVYQFEVNSKVVWLLSNRQSANWCNIQWLLNCFAPNALHVNVVMDIIDQTRMANKRRFARKARKHRKWSNSRFMCAIGEQSSIDEWIRPACLFRIFFFKICFPIRKGMNECVAWRTETEQLADATRLTNALRFKYVL